MKRLIWMLLSFLPLCANADQLVCPKNDFEAFSQAPRGAERVSANILEVNFARGKKRFINKVAVDYFDGKMWHYCGYHPEARVHLIAVDEKDVFSGVLLFEDSGKVVRVGNHVQFSPDYQSMLGIERDHNMDVETWTIVNASGRVQWRGAAGILQETPEDGPYALAEFQEPTFANNQTIEATMTCIDSGETATVRLRRAKGGGWQWKYGRRC